MPTASKSRVWILSHVEIMGPTSVPHPDVMLTHVARSRERALARMRATFVDPQSWWELRSFTVDQPSRERDDADEQRVEFFDYRWRPRASAPRREAEAAFARQRQAEIAAGLYADVSEHDVVLLTKSKPRRGRASAKEKARKTAGKSAGKSKRKSAPKRGSPGAARPARARGSAKPTTRRSAR